MPVFKRWSRSKLNMLLIVSYRDIKETCKHQLGLTIVSFLTNQSKSVNGEWFFRID
jgi:hypothetical protein